MIRPTAATVIVFDPQGVVDDSTCDDAVVVGPLTLDGRYQDEGESHCPWAVVTTMRNVDTGAAWYVVAYHRLRADADADYAYEAEQAKLTAEELDARPQDIDDYSDYTEGAALICL